MKIFLFILINNILPIILILLCGYGLNKKFKLNVNTLSKFNLYIYTPVFIFVKLYDININAGLLKLLFFVIILDVSSSLLSRLVGRIRHYPSTLDNAFTNSVMFYNSGNIGIPLITLIFSSAPFIKIGRAHV